MTGDDPARDPARDPDRDPEPGAEPGAERERAEAIGALDLEDKVALLTGADFWTLRPEPRLDLDALVLSDGPAGVRGTRWDEREPSLLLPSPGALGATWDADAAEEAGRLLGAQARDKGVHVLLAPTINLHRSPLGGRVFESYSEDPLLTAALATGFVRGVQSQGVGATPKHYVCNDSETERMTVDVRLDVTTLREAYLRPFEEVVAAGAWLVMAAYNGVGGTPMTEHRPLLTSVLKEQWGFDGVVVSDWFATRSTEISATAGLDLVMPGPHGPWGEHLVAAVREGRVDEATVDAKLARLLRLAERTGARGATAAASDTTPATPPDARARTRHLAARAMVVLTNDGTLPLAPGSGERLALLGPGVDRLTVQGGGSAQVMPERTGTLPDALRGALDPSVTLTAEPGAPIDRTLPPLDVRRCVDPVTGTAGLRLEALDGDGAVLASEQRQAAAVTLMGDAEQGGLPAGTRRLVLRGQLTPAHSGTHEIAAAGLGGFSLTVGATTLEGALVPQGDPVEAFLRPPEQRGTAELTADEPVAVTLVLDLPEGMPLATLRLGHRPPRPDADTALERAVAAAAQADTAVVVVGTTSEIESEGFDRDTLALPGRQDELVTRVAEVNPRTVVVVNAGAPVLLPWAEQVAAILWAWLPGQEGAEACVDALTGAVEPAGRLPTTLPPSDEAAPLPSITPEQGQLTYHEGTWIGHRAWAGAGQDPAFPFGHGLGLTSWEHQELAVTPRGHGGLAVTVRIRNVGARTGREVVQAYLEPSDDSEPARLVGFAAATVAAGAASTVTIPVAPRDLARWDAEAGAWAPRVGPHRVRVGRSAGDLRLVSEVRLDRA